MAVVALLWHKAASNLSKHQPISVPTRSLSYAPHLSLLLLRLPDCVSGLVNLAGRVSEVHFGSFASSPYYSSGCQHGPPGGCAVEDDGQAPGGTEPEEEGDWLALWTPENWTALRHAVVTAAAFVPFFVFWMRRGL